ncbi:MAG TPA: GGDEF domain-containing protein [Rhodocyclaceae bacterium]|nr:GGDEF domain-containing protein [Rhodocyclaceae bacterium]
MEVLPLPPPLSAASECLSQPGPQRLSAIEHAELLDIITRRALYPVFQPIIDFRVQAYIGFEGLIRGPVGSCLQFPNDLFEAAKLADLSCELEHICREVTLEAFARLRLPGRIFLNVTPGCLVDHRMVDGTIRELLPRLGIAPGRVVIELTENQRITDVPELQEVLARYRAMGVQIAIDDLGEGFSNLRMWSDVRPDFVKIDRHFIDGIADDRMKYHFVRAMQDLAESCASHLVAEGIEREEDFAVIRDMGIACGQGYFIAVPEPVPPHHPSQPVMTALGRQRVSLSPVGAVGGKPPTAQNLVRYIRPVAPEAINDELIERFEGDPAIDVLPVVQGTTPVGLITRQALFDQLARPFWRELYGRKPCSKFMDAAPLIVDQHATVQELGLMLARADKRYLMDGFIVTDEGRYLGAGSSHELMALITEMQISAARYANPLTQLPGNVPINEHIDRLLEAGAFFAACYADIDNFKPYNDTYGYRRGDDIIQLLGRILREVVDPRLDFVGHVGGDDFVILFQSGDWEARCQEIVHRFTEGVGGMVNDEDGRRGGYLAENRKGELVFQSLPSLSIGALRVDAGLYDSHREVAAAASGAKKQAKKQGGGTVFVERRRPVAEAARLC